MELIDGLLDIEDGVSGVHGGLVLGGLTDQTLLLVEGNVGGGSEATLLVGNDLDIVTLVGSNARVGSTYRNWLSVNDFLDGGR
jgi:hypothetical protein